MGSLNTHTMHTLCGTVLRSRLPRIRNYADNDGETGTGGNFRLSHAVARHIHRAQVIAQPQKLHSQLVWLVTAVMYQCGWFNVQFCLRHGSPTRGKIHNNLAGDALFLFFHVQLANQPTITGVDLYHKRGGRPWLTVIRYQPFVSVHKDRFHSQR